VIVLDAGVIIVHLDGQDAHHRRATTVLAGAVAEGFGVSPLILPEVLVGPARAGRLAAALAAVEAIGIDVVAPAADAPAQLASPTAGFGCPTATSCWRPARRARPSRRSTNGWPLPHAISASSSTEGVRAACPRAGRAPTRRNSGPPRAVFYASSD